MDDAERDLAVHMYWRERGIKVLATEITRFKDQNDRSKRPTYLIRGNIALGKSIGTFPSGDRGTRK